jgi:hypothetical protein
MRSLDASRIGDHVASAVRHLDTRGSLAGVGIDAIGVVAGDKPNRNAIVRADNCVREEEHALGWDWVRWIDQFRLNAFGSEPVVNVLPNLPDLHLSGTNLCVLARAIRFAGEECVQTVNGACRIACENARE